MRTIHVPSTAWTRPRGCRADSLSFPCSITIICLFFVLAGCNAAVVRANLPLSHNHLGRLMAVSSRSDRSSFGAPPIHLRQSTATGSQAGVTVTSSFGSGSSSGSGARSRFTDVRNHPASASGSLRVRTTSTASDRRTDPQALKRRIARTDLTSDAIGSSSTVTAHGSCATTARGCDDADASDLVLRHRAAFPSLLSPSPSPSPSPSQGAASDTTVSLDGAFNVRVRELGSSVTARQLQLVLLQGLGQANDDAGNGDSGNGGKHSDTEPGSASRGTCGLPYAPHYDGAWAAAAAAPTAAAGMHDSGSADSGMPTWRGFSPLPAISLSSSGCNISATCPTFSVCPGIGPGVEVCMNTRGTQGREGDGGQVSSGATSAIDDVAVELSTRALMGSCRVYERALNFHLHASAVAAMMPTWLLPSHCRGLPAVARVKALLMSAPADRPRDREAKEGYLREAELLLGVDADWPMTSRSGGKDVADMEGGSSDASGADGGCTTAAAAAGGATAAPSGALGDEAGGVSILERKEKMEGGGGWMGGVVLLRDVYVDRWGRVFNATHFFHAGRCSDDSTERLSFPRTTHVTELDDLLNLMTVSSDEWYSEAAQQLPLLYAISPLLDAIPDVPILIASRKRQRPFLSSVVGLHLNGPTVARVHSDMLLFARKLYLPILHPCGIHSLSLLHSLRSRHLLPPQGLPILSPTPNVTHIPPQPFLPNNSVPHDWVVVIAGPSPLGRSEHEFRALAVATELARKFLRELFGEKRVVEYKHGQPWEEALSLFRRALVLVASDHSLLNLFFMPFSSAVLEIRLIPSHSPSSPSSPSAYHPSHPHPLFPSSSSFPLNGSFLYSDLAAAAGVMHFLLPLHSRLNSGSNGNGNMSSKSSSSSSNETSSSSTGSNSSSSSVQSTSGKELSAAQPINKPGSSSGSSGSSSTSVSSSNASPEALAPSPLAPDAYSNAGGTHGEGVGRGSSSHPRSEYNALQSTGMAPSQQGRVALAVDEGRRHGGIMSEGSSHEGIMSEGIVRGSASHEGIVRGSASHTRLHDAGIEASSKPWSHEGRVVLGLDEGAEREHASQSEAERSDAKPSSMAAMVQGREGRERSLFARLGRMVLATLCQQLVKVTNVWAGVKGKRLGRKGVGGESGGEGTDKGRRRGEGRGVAGWETEERRGGEGRRDKGERVRKGGPSSAFLSLEVGQAEIVKDDAKGNARLSLDWQEVGGAEITRGSAAVDGLAGCKGRHSAGRSTRMHNRRGLSEEARAADNNAGLQLDWQEVARAEIEKGREAVDRLIGSEATLHTAMEGVAFHVYQSDVFPPASLDERSNSYADRIPGTDVSSAVRVGEFRTWQASVAGQGEWVRDPTPRRLGWVLGYPRYGRCDASHVEAGGIAGAEANRVADEWQAYASAHRGEESTPAFISAKKEAEERWRVREAVKYTWRPRNGSLLWTSLDGTALCSLAREKEDGHRSLNLVVLGDSLQEQFATVLGNALFLTHPVNVTSWLPVEECDRWLGFPEGGNIHEAGISCRKQVSPVGSVCGNASLNVIFVRHYFLHLSSHSLDAMEMGWSRMRGVIGWADAIIVNRGAHYTQDEDFRAGLRAALRYLRVTAPDTLIIARSTYAGHENCTNCTVPLEEPPTLHPRMLHHWSKIPPQNLIVKEEIEGIGGVFVDVAPMTALRADGHVGLSERSTDCLHYCIPGPLDGWAQLILNNLVQLLPKWGV